MFVYYKIVKESIYGQSKILNTKYYSIRELKEALNKISITNVQGIDAYVYNSENNKLLDVLEYYSMEYYSEDVLYKYEKKEK